MNNSDDLILQQVITVLDSVMSQMDVQLEVFVEGSKYFEEHDHDPFAAGLLAHEYSKLLHWPEHQQMLHELMESLPDGPSDPDGSYPGDYL